jgi:hypothetical protein
MVRHHINHEIHSSVVQRRGQVFQVISGAKVLIQRVAVVRSVFNSVERMLISITHISCCQYPWYDDPSEVF